MRWPTFLPSSACKRSKRRPCLRRVVEEIDTPLFTFDPDHVLRLMNASGERLLQQPMARLLGKTASQLELDACFEAPNETLVALPYSAPNARWMVRKRSFRQNGVPHTLIVLSDVSRALREEERSAWQKLIRVLGHELNNSLAPIISISGSLSSRLPLPELPAGTECRLPARTQHHRVAHRIVASLPAVISQAGANAFSNVEARRAGTAS